MEIRFFHLSFLRVTSALVAHLKTKLSENRKGSFMQNTGCQSDKTWCSPNSETFWLQKPFSDVKPCHKSPVGVESVNPSWNLSGAKKMSKKVRIWCAAATWWVGGSRFSCTSPASSLLLMKPRRTPPSLFSCNPFWFYSTVKLFLLIFWILVISYANLFLFYWGLWWT